MKIKTYTDIIIDALQGSKFNTLLEIGCGENLQNLLVIKKKYPKSKLWGYDTSFDLSQDCFKSAKEIIKDIPDITIKGGDCTKKEVPFNNMKFDIVCMVATFIIIQPENTEKVIENIKNSIKKELILIEMHSEEEKTNRITVRDYKKLLESSGFKEITLKKIPKEVWPGTSHKSDGYIIKAKI